MENHDFTGTTFGLVRTVSGRIDGFSRGATRRLVRDGVMEKVHHNVLRIADGDITPVQRAVAAAMRTGGAVSHGTLLRLEDVRGWRSFPEAHISSHDGRWQAIDQVIVHRRKGIEGLLRLSGDVLVSSVSLAIIDAGFDADVQRIRSAYHDAWHRGLLTPQEFAATLDSVAASGRLGVTRARELLERYPADGNPARSVNEIRLFDAIYDAGLPPPRLNHPVVRPGGKDAFIDLAWPEIGYGVEIDHTATHDAGTAEYDLRRHGDLTVMGWFLDRPMEAHLEGPDGLAKWVSVIAARLRMLGRGAA
jgi:hypothetical protein